MMAALRTIELRSQDVGVRILVDEGGQIEQIRDELFNRDWLASFGRHPQSAELTSFAEGSRAGFVDCFPSIAHCADPNLGRQRINISDHGDFWSRAWTVRAESNSSVILDTSKIKHPLHMSKRIRLEEDAAGLCIDYQLTNRSERAYKYLYSAHPLFVWPADAQVLMPSAMPMKVAFGEKIISDQLESEWPSVVRNGDHADVGRMPYIGDIENFKVFVASSGSCTLRIAGYERDLMIETDPELLPWFGVCVNRCAWPNSSDQERWIAIEPTTSPCDSLLDAIEGGTERCLLPGETSNWTIRIALVNSTKRPLAL